MTRFIALLAIVFGAHVHAATVLVHETGEIRFEGPPQRIVALNWAMVETLLGLGVMPAAVAEPEGYRTWANHPPLPDGALDVGNRREPNLEAISQARPDLILVSGDLHGMLPAFEAIAPTAVYTLFKPGQDPAHRAAEVVQQIAIGLGREEQGTALLDRVAELQAQNAERLRAAGRTDTPVLLMSFLDERSLRVHAPNALLSTALEELGLDNAWEGESNFWGFATINLAQLGKYPGAHFLIIKPTPPGLHQALERNPVWQALQPVKAGRVTELPPVWTFGSVLTKARMGQVLTETWLD
ncbi:iron complex transport system substrate-binding protein [Halopseudomonas xinjiangensis]|uniref:Iron complex transport system substrate-binding protein n=1 Tax=Halopseudomonas xinjiangensis TaxID=487184 RepID=A0A1H1X123_9GAMM|nr:ABC transporter substrate-binding protein [Halopseudomonas xinjiangensis]SDT03033.1 iron complex transport system substrate-binding protein [Halopseudomonas xinjiangensis]